MTHVAQNPDGTYSWSCPIEKPYHQKKAIKGVWGCVFIVAFILILYALIPASPHIQKELWVPLIPIAVILAIAIPLLYLQYTASDPHEQYVMTEEYVKSGYGKEAVYAEFKKTKELLVTSEYIELIGNYGRNRIFVPSEDREFILDYIRKRLPEDVK